ncbi:MAG TPA: hypothetical protein ENG14_06935 [Thermodesulforhabdus norvegica]|uniref:5-formyltetrahydrofolate cyclo-ligase n=1 Tax=Thermodesulforhabdus norvegica TaxID=39841 RepID=A0A7C1B2B9_9BACT|nr:hypothetical protein [Thermodesulforhabdus norvegica]
MRSKDHFQPRLRNRRVFYALKRAKEKLRTDILSGRNPDEHGFRQAAERLRGTFVYRGARVIYVSIHPFTEQIRFNALMDNKVLVLPDAQLQKGFFLLDPASIHPRNRLKSVRPSGIRKFGKQIDFVKKRNPFIQLAITEVLTACTETGALVGDGSGHFDLQTAVLNFLGWFSPGWSVIAVTDHLPRLTAGTIPMKENDRWANLVAVPERVFYTTIPDTPEPTLIGEILDRKRIRRSDLLFHIFSKRAKNNPKPL